MTEHHIFFESLDAWREAISLTSRVFAMPKVLSEPSGTPGVRLVTSVIHAAQCQHHVMYHVLLQVAQRLEPDVHDIQKEQTKQLDQAWKIFTMWAKDEQRLAVFYGAAAYPRDVLTIMSSFPEKILTTHHDPRTTQRRELS